MTKLRLCALATTGLFASVSAVALYQGLAGAELTRQVKLALSQIPGSGYSAIDVDVSVGKVAVKKFSVTTGRSTVSADLLTFKMPALHAPGIVSPAFAAGGSASADNVVITMANSVISIPKVEATGTDLTNADLIKLFDPKDPADLASRFQKLTADKISIPDMSIDYKSPDVAEHVDYKGTELDGAANGKIQQYFSSSSTFLISGKSIKNPVEGRLGATRGHNLDLLLYARFLNESRKSADAPLETFYDDYSIDGAVVQAKDVNVKIGKLTGDKVMGRPLLTPLSQFQTLNPKPGEKPDAAQSAKIFSALSDMFSSISLGTTNLENITATFGGNTKAGSLQIASARIGNFANMRIGSILVEGFNLKSSDANVAFRTFGVQGINLKPGFDMLQNLPKMLGPDGNNTSTANPRSFVPTLDQVLVADFDLDVVDKKHNGNSDDGGRDKFTIGKFQIDGSNYQLGIPTSLSASLQHLALKLPKKDPSSQQLLTLGYGSIDVSSALDFAWSEADSTLTLKMLSFSGENMGGVALSALMGNVPKDLFVGDAAVAQAAALGINIKNVDVRLQNTGLFDKVLEHVARQQNKTVDQVRQDVANAVRTTMTQVFGDIPQATTITNAVVSFVQQSKSLAIFAKSARGVSAADAPLLQNPPEFLKRLDVTATANQ